VDPALSTPEPGGTLDRIVEGTVRRVRPRLVQVLTDEGCVEAHVRSLLKKDGPRVSAHVVAVGDRVRVVMRGSSGAWLDRILPRANRISRVDPGDIRREHVLAANLDQVALIASWTMPRFNPRAVDRLLVMGENAGVPCLVVLNKIDLMPPCPPEEDPVQPYRDLGYPVLLTSATEGSGLDGMQNLLHGRITLMVGSSGTGKSTLLNRLVPGLDLRTSPVSGATSKGVHTTTRVDWIELPGCGAVLDSPGIRSIQPWGLTDRNLASCFPEMRGLPPCRFSDCLHQSEPECSVRAAVEAGSILRFRHDSYLRILESLREGANAVRGREQA